MTVGTRILCAGLVKQKSMPDTPKFVVNDRRKFTAEGELRHDETASTASAEREAAPPASAPEGGPRLVSSPTTAELSDLPESASMTAMPSSQEIGGAVDPLAEQEAAEPQEFQGSDYGDDSLPAGPSDEQSAEAARTYNATVDRLDTALRAADPGGERMPEMSFERLTQSLYTQALLLLGGGAQPGETPRVDILGARQTIDMIAIIADKTKGNLTSDESKLLESALFDLRMGFLEITQALARQAAQRQGAGTGGFGAPVASGGFGGPGGTAGGPRIVR